MWKRGGSVQSWSYLGSHPWITPTKVRADDSLLKVPTCQRSVTDPDILLGGHIMWADPDMRLRGAI